MIPASESASVVQQLKHGAHGEPRRFHGEFPEPSHGGPGGFEIPRSTAMKSFLQNSARSLWPSVFSVLNLFGPSPMRYDIKRAERPPIDAEMRCR